MNKEQIKDGLRDVLQELIYLEFSPRNFDKPECYGENFIPQAFEVQMLFERLHGVIYYTENHTLKTDLDTASYNFVLLVLMAISEKLNADALKEVFRKCNICVTALIVLIDR